jgi:hypothetical protein
MEEQTEEIVKPIDLAPGVHVNHLITKKLEPGRMVLFLEIINNTDVPLASGNLYVDLRTLLGIKVAIVAFEIPAETKPRERFIFRVDIPKYATKFKKFGWFYKTANEQYTGTGKNSGKFDDLVKYQKLIDKLEAKV